MMTGEPVAAAAPAAPQRQSPYNVVMAIWASWQTLKDYQHSDGDGHPQDAKDFMRTGEAVEVMVNDLPREQKWAVYKARGICTAWIFPNLNFADAVAAAEDAILPKMKINLATRRYFN